MRYSLQLSSAQPDKGITVQFEPQYMVVDNPTGSAIYIRVGAADIPNAQNCDRVVAAGTQIVLPTIGKDFGFSLSNPTALNTGQPVSGTTFTKAIVTFLKDEPPPALGSISYVSLSQSDQLNGEQSFLVVNAGNRRLGPFDLGGWGGLLIYVRPDSTSGQGSITVRTHQDAANPNPPELTHYPIWANSPFMMILPRVNRYVWIDLAPLAGTLFDGNISGFIAARSTLTEIIETRFIPFGGQTNYGFSITNTSVEKWLYTGGMPALELVMKYSTYTRGDVGNVQFFTSPNGSGQGRFLKSVNPWLKEDDAEWHVVLKGLEDYLRIVVNNDYGNVQSGTLTWYPGDETEPEIDQSSLVPFIVSVSPAAGTYLKCFAAPFPLGARIRQIRHSRDIADTVAPFHVEYAFGTSSAVVTALRFISEQLTSGGVFDFPGNGIAVPSNQRFLWLKQDTGDNPEIAVYFQ